MNRNGLYLSGQRLAALVGVCLALFGVGMRAQAQTTDIPSGWPGPDGQYLSVEAETLQPQGAGWTVVDEPRSYFMARDNHSGLSWLSGTEKGEGSASREVLIPAAGAYRFWVRYAQSPGTETSARAPFRVLIEQNGKTVFSHTYDETQEGQTPTAGATAPALVWVAQTASLEQGAARITIGKASDGTVSTGLPQVDALLLTTDTNYEPNFRDFGPQTYVRIRLKRADPVQVYFYAGLTHSREPYFHNMAIDKTGAHVGQVLSAPSEFLAAGEATPWMNFSRLLYPDGDAWFNLTATSYFVTKPAGQSDYEVDFATAPNDKSIVKTLQRSGVGHGMQIVLPPDLVEERRPKSDLNYAQITAATVSQLQPIQFGRKPTRMPMLASSFTVSDITNSPGTRSLELKAFDYLGLNGIASPLSAKDAGDPLRFGIISVYDQVWHFEPRGGLNQAVWSKIDESVKQGALDYERQGYAKNTTIVKLMDEPSSDALSTIAAEEKNHPVFRKWLQQEGYQPQQLGAASWDEVRLTADRNAQPPLLYLLSNRFRAWAMVNFFATAGQIIKKHYPPSARTTLNFSDGATSYANMYAQGNDYFLYFKNHALDIAFSEDWTNGSTAKQLTGWNVGLLRSATKYHSQPIGMYVITSFSDNPLLTKLKASSNIAQGAKTLEFYAYLPTYQGYEPSWYHKWPLYPAVAEVTHEIGAAEDILVDAMPVKAQTAILYSTPSDIWSLGHDYAPGMERMLTYLALRHGQVPVDILSDEDARTGHLKDYKVAYLFGEQLDTRNVAPLAEWVKAGGTLVLAAGAAGRDELNQPSNALDRVLGLQRAPLETLSPMTMGITSTLHLFGSQGKVALHSNGTFDKTVDLLASKQNFGAMPQAEVLAKFEDGKPAALSVKAGRGKVVLVGFEPAIAYLREAHTKFVKADKEETFVEPLQAVSEAQARLGQKPDKIKQSEYFPMPSEYNSALRQWMLNPAVSATVRKPVETTVAQVEATLMEGKNGWVVPLANYTGAPLKSLKLTIHPSAGRAFGSVYSARRGVLIAKPDGSKEVSVTIPLESTDFIYARWARD